MEEVTDTDLCKTQEDQEKNKQDYLLDRSKILLVNEEYIRMIVNQISY